MSLANQLTSSFGLIPHGQGTSLANQLTSSVGLIPHGQSMTSQTIDLINWPNYYGQVMFTIRITIFTHVATIIYVPSPVEHGNIQRSIVVA